MKINYKLKEIDIKNRTYYFFNDMINVRNFDPNKTKIREKNYVWNPNTYACKIHKYLKSIFGDSAVICDEII